MAIDYDLLVSTIEAAVTQIDDEGYTFIDLVRAEVATEQDIESGGYPQIREIPSIASQQS